MDNNIKLAFGHHSRWKQAGFDCDEKGLPIENEYSRKMRNSTGAITANGLRQLITTQTAIYTGYLQTKFYELLGQKPSDFVDFEIGFGADSTDLFQYTATYTGGAFEDGIISLSSGEQGNSVSSIEVGGFKIQNNFWRKDYVINQEALAVASKNNQAFSLIDAKEQARKKNWDLGIQYITFLGLKDGTVKGLLNQSTVTVDTSLLPVKITSMTAAQLKTFVASLLSTYLANSNYTAMPNTYAIPTNEWAGLGAFISDTFPLMTYREAIEKAFEQAGVSNIKIVHSVYANTASASGNRGRHVLYNKAPESFRFIMPRDYTPHPLFPLNGLDMISVAQGQFCGFVAFRPAEMLYIDVQS